MRALESRITTRSGLIGLGGLAVGVAVTVAGCGSSSSSSSQAGTSGKPASFASSPGTEFGTANIAGLGTVLVDGKGKTVYILTSGGHTNMPCSDSNGCTKVWPDLPFPDGVSAAKAGNGVQASLLGKMKLSDGETYPTYNGWLMYEFGGDSGPGQANGQGKMSFGGSWSVLDAAGNPVTTPSGAAAGPAPTPTTMPTATTMPTSGGGYGGGGGGGY